MSADQEPLIFSEQKPRSYYARKIAHHAVIVRAAYGLNLNHTTQQRWTDFWYFMRAADTYLDTPDGLRSQEEKNTHFINYVAEGDYGKHFAYLTKNALGADAHDALTRRTISLIHHNHAAKQATSPLRLIANRAREGQLTADIVLGLTEHIPADDAKFLKFADHFRKAGAISTVFDTASDFHEDTVKEQLVLPYGIATNISLFSLASMYSMRKLRHSTTRAMQHEVSFDVDGQPAQIEHELKQ